MKHSDIHILFESYYVRQSRTQKKYFLIENVCALQLARNIIVLGLHGHQDP